MALPVYIVSSIKSFIMKSIIIVLAILACQLTYAQQRQASIRIQSTIEDSNCELDVSIRSYQLLTTGSDPKVMATAAAPGCSYTLTGAFPDGEYELLISSEGVSDQKIPITLHAENAAIVEVGPLRLQRVATELEGVTIYGNKREYIKVEADKTTVSIKENNMLNSGTALDAVKKIPGVVTSPSGGLTLNGRAVAIYIDGAPSSLTGDDLLNYLQGLPASAIDKAELIFNPGASYDANSSGSVINIISSSKRMKGVNASFGVNYNFNRNQKPSPQILMNGKVKNLSWQTMLGYNYMENENWTNTEQEFTFFTPRKYLNQKTYNYNINRNLYFRNGLNYKLSPMSNLLFNYNLNMGNDRTLYDASAEGEGINFTNNGSSKMTNLINEFSLQYKTKLDTLGRSLDITAYSNLFERNPMSKSVSNDNGLNTYNNNDIQFDLKNYYLKYDFALPFSKMDFSVNTGAKYNYTEVSDLGKYNFEQPDDAIFGSGEYNDMIDFQYKERNLAFYAEARKKIKKFYFTGGLRYENYDVERDAGIDTDKIKYVNRKVFPNLSLMYEIRKDINVSSTYSKKISQPGYYTIDPNNGSTYNKYNSSAGDIALQPVYFDNYEVKVSAFQYVQLGANYTVARNMNNFVFSAEDGALVSNQTFAASDEIRTVSGFLSFPVPFDYFFKGAEVFKERMNTIHKMNYMFVNLNYVKTSIDGPDLKRSPAGTVNINAQSQILLPWGITNNMMYFYLPKGNWEIYKILKPIQQFDISFHKEFMNRKMKLGLHCFDVFNSNEVNAMIAAKNLNTRFYQKQDSRTFRVSLTYNFGNLKLDKENTDIQTDRLNQGGGMLK